MVRASAGSWMRTWALAAVALGATALGTTPASAQTAGFSISQSSDDRQVVVAGCVPMKVKPKFIGSTWVACNDPNSELAVDKLVETSMVSCTDMFPNGVVRGFFIDEVNNRSWESFRFSCADLRGDGTVGSESKKSENLFDFSGNAKHHETVVAGSSRLPLGVLEVYNQLQFRESLLQVGIEHHTANAIFDAARRNERATDTKITDRIPKASPQLIGTQFWRCPAGSVLTGASVGHIPHGNEKWTRAVFISMECRKLLASNPDAVPVVRPPAPLVLGAKCSVDSECGSGKCGNVEGKHVCVCSKDTDCGAGRYCNQGVDLKTNACETLKADNDSCALVDGGRTCKSGQCRLGRCYTPNSVAMGGTCYVDDACSQGKCSSVDGAKGSCVCKEDSDCGSGDWCDKGVDLSKNSCKRKLNKGEICGTVGELGVGHRCKSGDCKVSGISKNLKCQ